MILTGELTGQDLCSETQAAVPALRQDAEVTRDHGREELAHHRRVLVHISIEQLRGRINMHEAATISKQ